MMKWQEAFGQRLSRKAFLLAIVAKSMPSDPLAERLVRDLPTRLLEHLTDVSPYVPSLPNAFEVSLAKHLSGHECEALRAWFKDPPAVVSTHSDSLVRGSSQAGNSRRANESGLSVRATDEACMYIKHPLFEAQQHNNLHEVLKSSFCGRFAGRWDDITTDAGAVWANLQGPDEVLF